MFDNSFKISINKENLLHNIEYLKKLKNKKILPVVKGNAYGHGLTHIVSILYESGQRNFAVARLSEGEFLINTGLFPEISILIFESVWNLDYIRKNPSLIIAINSFSQLENALDFGIPSKQLHLKIDFGFCRNGISFKAKNELISFVHRNNLYFGGIFSHLFAVNHDDGLNIINNFTTLVNEIGKDRFQQIHIQNSFSTLSYDCEIATHIRPGLIIYGLQENGFYDSNLRQVFSLTGAVEEIKNLDDNQYLGYRTLSNCEIKDYKRVAKLKIGYGDGFIKKNENGKCLINNKEYHMELISMDNTFIPVDSGVKVGDSVSLYYNIKESMAHLDMEGQEFLILLNDRIKHILE